MRRAIFSSNPDLADRGGYYLLIGLIGFILVVLDQSTNLLQQTKSTITDVASTIAIAGGETRKRIRSQYSIMQDQSLLVEKIDELERDNNKLQAIMFSLKPLKEENERLRVLLRLSRKQSASFHLAEVVEVPYNPLNQWLIVNLGSKDGVQIGQQVISSNAIVGQVSEVFSNTSKVLAISDKSHSLPIELVSNNIPLLAEGTSTNGLLVVRSIDNNVQISKGEEVMTSGLGGVFDPGQPVGTITDIIFDAGNRTNTKEIFISTHINIASLKYVFIIFPNTNSDPSSDTVSR